MSGNRLSSVTIYSVIFQNDRRERPAKNTRGAKMKTGTMNQLQRGLARLRKNNGDMALRIALEDAIKTLRKERIVRREVDKRLKDIAAKWNWENIDLTEEDEDGEETREHHTIMEALYMMLEWTQCDVNDLNVDQDDKDMIIDTIKDAMEVVDVLQVVIKTTLSSDDK